MAAETLGHHTQARTDGEYRQTFSLSQMSRMMPASVLPWREKVVAKKPTYNSVYNMDKLFILLKDGKVLKGIKDKSCSHISIPDSVTSIGR
ncbi:MAG: hypothetical protein IKN22_00180, partial [Bacteroidaceae bacterium]|nr:hypothetical protein [Bacteroidaceae bacterium]